MQDLLLPRSFNMPAIRSSIVLSLHMLARVFATKAGTMMMLGSGLINSGSGARASVASFAGSKS
jgi:hypothetical protein